MAQIKGKLTAQELETKAQASLLGQGKVIYTLSSRDQSVKERSAWSDSSLSLTDNKSLKLSHTFRPNTIYYCNPILLHIWLMTAACYLIAMKYFNK